MLKRLKNTLIWKEWHRNRRKSGLPTKPPDKGLGTNVRPSKIVSPSTDVIPSRELITCLSLFEKRVLNNLRLQPNRSPQSDQVEDFFRLLGRDKNFVSVSTDKTSSFKLVPLASYQRWMNEHIDGSDAQRVTPADLQSVQTEANQLLDDATGANGTGEFPGGGFPINNSEAAALRQAINSCQLPQPFLLLKDHKPLKPNGDYKTRFVLPAQSFMAMFGKIGYKAIQKIFDDNKVEYGTKTIVNARHLKDTLEPLNLKRESSTIFSLDIVDFYPSITFKLVKKAIQHYVDPLDLPDTDKNIVDVSLEFIQYGMENQFFQFGPYYYKYGNHLDNGFGSALAIGAFESAWLADLVASYLLEEAEDLFNGFTYFGIYRDDGICIAPHVWPSEDIVEWLEEFQATIDEICLDENGDEIARVKFTAEVWKPTVTASATSPNAGPVISTISASVTERQHVFFPYLDLKLEFPRGQSNTRRTFTRHASLDFFVHLKENQQLRYLNDGSTHSKATFRAVPQGVINRLVSLTSLRIREERIDEVYPDHCAALRSAGLAPNIFPTFQQVRQKEAQRRQSSPSDGSTTSTKSTSTGLTTTTTTQILRVVTTVMQPTNPSSSSSISSMESTESVSTTTLREWTTTSNPPINKRRSRKRKEKRTIYLCLGVSNIWIEPIVKIFKDCISLFPTLSWIRFQMSYHRFPNFTDRMKADLTAKLNENIASSDVRDNDPCNCGPTCVFDGLDGQCRRRNVVYRITCKTTGRSYIGNTSDHLKTRLNTHIRNARKMVWVDSMHRFQRQNTNQAWTIQSLRHHRLTRRCLNDWRPSSTSFATFVAEHLYKNYIGQQPTVSEIRDKFTYSIIWKGKQLACHKTYGTWDCRLCCQERLAILHAYKFNPDRGRQPMINHDLEIHGHCPHSSRLRFHPLMQLHGNTGADDSD